MKKQNIKNKIKNTKGITLIALVISIIVMLILAGVSLNIALGENGVIKNAIKATVYQRFSTYLEEFQINSLNSDEDILGQGEDLKKYISTITDEDIEKFVIINGNLYYCGNVESEKNVANNLGMDISLAGTPNVEDVKELVQYFCDVETEDIQEEERIGEKLFVYNQNNYLKVSKYDDNFREIASYADGYYYLEEGTTLENGTVLTSAYLINYDTNDIILFGDDYKLWSNNSPLAVSGELALNLDATTFAKAEAWTDITNNNVVYISEPEEENAEMQQKKSLYFNGTDSYIALSKEGLSFENGFTFEFYGNFNTLLKNDSEAEDSNIGMGMFCKVNKINGLNSTDVQRSMRFGYLVGPLISRERGIICKFYSSSVRTSTDGIFADGTGGIRTTDGLRYEANEDVYMTFVYRRATEVEGDNDVVEYYVNGALIGRTEYPTASYDSGRAFWDNDDYKFYVGCTPWGSNGYVYYMDGSIYAVRLYNKTLTEEQIKANRETTIRYRNSFLD